jgi:hypothetical protein
MTVRSMRALRRIHLFTVKIIDCARIARRNSSPHMQALVNAPRIHARRRRPEKSWKRFKGPFLARESGAQSPPLLIRS